MDPVITGGATLGNFAFNVWNLFTRLLGRPGAECYPAARITPYIESYMDGNSGQTIFYFMIENLDSKFHVLNTHISVYFADPFARWPLWKKWILYAEDKAPDISPGSTSDRILLTRQGSIENFVEKAFGGRIIKEVPRNPVNRFRHAVVRDMKLTVRVKVSYKSSIINSGKYTFLSQYTVTPIGGAPERWVTNWLVEEI